MRAYRKVREQMSRLTAAHGRKHRWRARGQAFSREEVNLARFQELHESLLRTLSGRSPYFPYLHAVPRTDVRRGHSDHSGLWRHAGDAATTSPWASSPRSFFTWACSSGRSKRWAIFTTPCSPPPPAPSASFICSTPSRRCRNRPGAQPLAADSRPRHLRERLVPLRHHPAGHVGAEDIRFEAKPGETVALVGHTGSGKTSIISLIARFYEPQRGRITHGRD